MLASSNTVHLVNDCTVSNADVSAGSQCVKLITGAKYCPEFSGEQCAVSLLKETPSRVLLKRGYYLEAEVY